MSGITTLWYAVVDQAHSHISPVTSLELSMSSPTIEHVKKEVKRIKDASHYVNIACVNVYRTFLKLDAEEQDNFQEKVVMTLKEKRPLRGTEKLRDCNIGEEEILLVELPWRDVFYCIVDQSHRIIADRRYFEINADYTIHQLRKRFVKEEQDYCEVQPAALNVYKSSLVAIDEDFEQKVSALLKKEKPLRPAKKLRDCNIGEEEMLLVELPWVTVWYRLANENNIFEGAAMKVSAVAVSDLRLRVKGERPNDLQHVDAAKLVIWRHEPHFQQNTESEFIENIKDDANATALPSSTYLRDLNLGNNDLLIVQFLGPSLDKPRSPRPLSKISQLRNKVLEAKMTFSEMRAEELQKLQQKTNPSHILCNRPPEVAPTIPATLLHPILNEFQHDCENYIPQTDDYRFAEALSVLSEFYSCESERQQAFLNVCRAHNLDIRETEPGSSYCTEGIIARNLWPCLIVGFKNEIGATGEEPVFQTAGYYRMYLSTAAAGDFCFTCPCIGMHVAGPSIGFFGMAFTTQFNLQMLGQIVRVDYHRTASSQWTILARHLGALREAVKKLERLYESGNSNMTMQVNDDGLFFPAYYRFDADNSENEVQYISQPMPEKLLFTGKWDRKDVMIKFVQRYSIQAHRSCAQRGSAPKLFGWRELKGGWTMVVMERLDESWKTLDTPNTKELYGRIRTVLDEMHHDKFVHGDVRDANIMIKEEGGEYRIKLVDFDWAGRIGQTVYPRNVGDCKQLRRPEGVCDGKEIKKEHDLMMLDFLFAGVVDCDSPWWQKNVD